MLGRSKQHAQALVVAGVLVMSGCEHCGKQTLPRTSWQDSALHQSSSVEPPLIQAWDGGSHMLRVAPSLIFAVWRDGATLRRVGSDLLTGKLTQGQVATLRERLRSAGVLGARSLNRHVVPDGPEFVVVVADDGGQATLRYHGHDEWVLQEMDARSTDSLPPEVREFLQRWWAVQGAIRDAEPGCETPFRGTLELRYPGD